MIAAPASLPAPVVRPEGARVAVHVRPQPIGPALLDLALQLHVSFGGDVAACGGQVRALEGDHSPEEAFALLTRGAGCRVDRLDARTFVAHRRSDRRRALSAPRARPDAVPPAASVPPATPSLKEVVVTAGRSALELATYPGARTVIASADLGEASHRDIHALTLDAAAIESTNLGPGRDKVFLRGLSDGAFTGAVASTVSVYLNDLPVSYNAPDPDLRLADIDRVEVLAGPQGALFGAGSIGGVVRVIPRAPSLAGVEGEVEAGVTSVAHGGAGSDVEGVLNLPLVADRVAVRVVGYRGETPGYLDEPALGLRDANAVLRSGGRGSVLLQISPDWSATAGAAYQDIDSAGAQYVTPGAGPLRDLARVRTPQDNDFGEVSAGLQGRLSFATLRVSAAYVSHTTDTVYDATDGVAAFLPGPSGPATYDETHRRRLAYGEAVLTSAPQRRFAWSAGVFLAHSTDRGRALLGTDASEEVFREDRTDQVDEIALFDEAAYRLSSRLTVRAGLRVFRSTLTTAALEQAPAGRAPSSFDGATTTTDASPKVQLEWSATPRLFTYLSFATGYRPSEFNTAAPPGTVFDQASSEPRRVSPDAVRTYEAGLRWTDTGGGHVEAAAYYTDWRSVQSDRFNGYGLPETLNIGDAAVPGFELSGAWPIADHWTASGSVLLDDPHQLSVRSAAAALSGGATLPGVSSASAALGLAWRALVAGWTLSAEAHARYVGPSRLQLAAALGGRMGDYVENSAELAVSRGRWTLRGVLQNLTDAHPDTFAFGDPFLPARVGQLTPEVPRTFTLSLRRAF